MTISGTPKTVMTPLCVISLTVLYYNFWLVDLFYCTKQPCIVLSLEINSILIGYDNI